MKSHLLRAVVIGGVAALGLTALAAVPATAADVQATFVVSPAGTGSDCTATAPCSIDEARTLVRAAAPTMTGDLVVEFGDGDYHVTSAIALTAADSGHNGHRIIWRAAAGATPTIDGGQSVTGWTQWAGNNAIWKVHTGAIDSRQFYVDGVRQPRASSPASVLGAITKTATGYTVTTPGPLGYNPEDTEFVYTGAAGAQVGWEAWVDRRCGVASVSGTTVTMDTGCYGGLASITGVQGLGNPTSVENNLAFLDQPGEWYWDKNSQDLYWMPPAAHWNDSAWINAQTAVVPTATGLVTGTNVSDFTIQGLSFQNATWTGPSGPNGFIDIQAAIQYTSTANVFAAPPAALDFSGSHDVAIYGNSLAHIGQTAVQFTAGSHDNVIQANTITDISGSGISLGSVNDRNPAVPDNGNVVADNSVSYIGQEFRGAVGILGGYVASTTIRNNTVQHVPYTGISVGWGWGGASILGDNHIVQNCIADTAQSPLFDSGLIYLNGPHNATPRSTVTGNYLNGDPKANGGVIYADGSTSNYDITGNVVTGSANSWVKLQDIAGQVAQNNVLADNFSDTSAVYLGTPQNRNLIGANTVGAGSSALPAAVAIHDAACTPRTLAAPATPAGLSARATTSAAVASWTSVDNGNSPLTGADVEARAADGTTIAATCDDAGRTSACAVGGLKPGATYQLRVRASNVLGVSSWTGWSTAVVVPAATVDPPAGSGPGSGGAVGTGTDPAAAGGSTAPGDIALAHTGSDSSPIALAAGVLLTFGLVLTAGVVVSRRRAARAAALTSLGGNE